MWLVKQPETDHMLATDACLTGYGGICGSEYFHGQFPPHMKGKNIAYLEIWAVQIAVNIWRNKLRGTYFWIHVDNEAVATILNTGASRDPTLQGALGNILMIAAKHEFMIKARHIRGVDNRIPDWLSRWQEPDARKKLQTVCKE